MSQYIVSERYEDIIPVRGLPHRPHANGQPATSDTTSDKVDFFKTQTRREYEWSGLAPGTPPRVRISPTTV
jgi:hypothetical protein